MEDQNIKMKYEDSRDHSLIDRLYPLWHEAFGDDRDFVKFFLENLPAKCQLLTIHDEDKIVSMTTFMPADLVSPSGDEVPCYYAYAVATLKSHRKRGFAERVLKTFQEEVKMPIILTPASEGLSKYYEKLGFWPFAREAEGRSLPAVNFRKAEKECQVLSDYQRTRNHLLSQTFGWWVKWHGETLSFALGYYGFFGGKSEYKAGEWVKISSSEEVVELIGIRGDSIYMKKSALGMILPYKESSPKVEKLLESLRKDGNAYLNLVLD